MFETGFQSVYDGYNQQTVKFLRKLLDMTNRFIIKKCRDKYMRKEEKTRLRREKIITAALFEFATKGYQGFVINELCKVDGISKGVLYHNFSGKSDLYLTCVQESFEKALAVLLGGGRSSTLLS